MGGRPDNGLIVVGVDVSPAAAAALRWAAGEAAVRGFGLCVVHAWERPSHMLAPYAHRTEAVSDAAGRAAAQRALHAAVAAALGEDAHVPVTLLMEEGRPEQVLPRLAAGADMLVLGARAPRDRAFAGLGPTLRACLCHAPCAVVVVSAGCGPTAAGAPRAAGRQPA